MKYLTAGFGWSLLTAFFLISFILLQGAVTAYHTSTISQAQQTFNQILAERETLTAYAIFANNLYASWTLIVPIVGIFPFLIVMYNTGWIIGELSLAAGVYPTIIVWNLITTMFLEILAYTIMLGENIYLSFLILTRGGAKDRLSYALLSLILYVLLLFIAAGVEIALIGA